jgi:hypothetical protein
VTGCVLPTATCRSSVTWMLLLFHAQPHLCWTDFTSMVKNHAVQVGLQSSCSAHAARYFILTPEARRPSAEQFVRSTASLFDACGLGTLVPFPASPTTPEGAVVVCKTDSPTSSTGLIDAVMHCKAGAPLPAKPQVSLPSWDHRAPSNSRAAGSDTSAHSRQALIPQTSDGSDNAMVFLHSAAPGTLGKDGRLQGQQVRDIADTSCVSHSPDMPLYGHPPPESVPSSVPTMQDTGHQDNGATAAVDGRVSRSGTSTGSCAPGVSPRCLLTGS